MTGVHWAQKSFATTHMLVLSPSLQGHLGQVALSGHWTGDAEDWWLWHVGGGGCVDVAEEAAQTFSPPQ